ncbi:MAG: hemolysin family protein [Chlamydiales bacterium]|nr:hemolysin family protein [Chlamydiales bacterium]
MQTLLLSSLFFLLGTFFLTAITSAFRRLRKYRSQKTLQSTRPLFFYLNFQKLFFKHRDFEVLFLASVCARHIIRLLFAFCALIFVLDYYLKVDIAGSSLWDSISAFHLYTLFAFAMLSLLVGEFLPRTWAIHFPEAVLKWSGFFASIYLLLCFPISFIFLKLSVIFTRAVFIDQMREPVSKVEDKIIEIIQETDIQKNLDANDKKIIKSMVTFRDRIVREVMVPRIDIFSLPEITTIKSAAEQIQDEGFSRIPVYKDSVDNILGVLMYKDLIEVYGQSVENKDFEALNRPIETLVKPVLFTPETKKISDLLQEFKKHQMHLAMVVDEYGGTEGLVTIEDILEEIVGEIEDEYDEDEERLYHLRTDGVWEVDARMTIIDIEEKLGLKIPHEGDYDTIGGYVYHKIGTIPDRGVIIHHDEFELEILQSSERCVEKIAITPLSSQISDKASGDE